VGVVPASPLPAPRDPRRVCVVMGVLNVTPDSFSDGGDYLDADAAVARGLTMWEEGADVVDVGGESTRPGAGRVDEVEELRRVAPVVRRLADEGVVVSVDTMRATVAARALTEGAVVVNDVSGGLADPDMAATVAAAGAPFVVMHWRGHSVDMASRATYDDVVAEVVEELAARLAELRAAGVTDEQVVVDPGLGFAKDDTHNWTLLAHIDGLTALGRPVLVGASRKGFLGRLLGQDPSTPRPTEARDVATAALSALLVDRGVWGVRVHDVRSTVDALDVVAAMRSARLEA
jgi:dihydropteroate synthase